MKKIPIIFSIIKKSSFANLIIIFQIIIIFFNIIPNYNIIKENNKYIEIAKKSSLKNAIYYMNEEMTEYQDKNTKKRKTNLNELIKNKKRLYNIAKTSDVVKSITPYRISDGYYVDQTTGNYRVYDKETLKIIEPYISEGNLPNSKLIQEIVLIRTDFTKGYKVGDIIELKGEEKSIKVKICGIIDNPNIYLINTTKTSNMTFPIKSLFEKFNYKGERILAFITDDTDTIKSLMHQDDFYSFQPQSIIYFNDNVSDKEIKHFTDIIKKENLGYFIPLQDMIKEQSNENNYILNSKIDYFAMLILIILIALISISFYIQKKNRKQIRIYMLSGANKKDIFFIFLIYYLIIYLFASTLYFTFVRLGQIGVFGDSILFSNVIYNFSINMVDFTVITLFIIFIFVLISYLPIAMIDKNKYIDNIKE
ncbi:ABC transporter permease [Helcococcus kunzii]|uniref:ABC transporter permease n=1 Tax=Helcococcus kunzii TaxID=40091 RepID=UPI001C968BA3|nr:ABC transporter permease [Helcococcus kunzii]QZO76746.1 ABC transporter permease [Helcococcus kunzii]